MEPTGDAGDDYCDYNDDYGGDYAASPGQPGADSPAAQQPAFAADDGMPG